MCSYESRCYVVSLNVFIGECLLDQPPKPLALPELLPGVSYSLDRQCELAFGTGSKPCPFIETPCSRLWCTGKTRGQLVCQTRHFPWADGTACGDERLCLRGVCIEKRDVAKIRVSAVPSHTHTPRSTSETKCMHVDRHTEEPDLEPSGNVCFLPSSLRHFKAKSVASVPSVNLTVMRHSRFSWNFRGGVTLAKCVSQRVSVSMPTCYLWPPQRCFGMSLKHKPPAGRRENNSALCADQSEHVCLLLRWMADGGSGVLSERAPGHVEVGFSWLKGSATTHCLQTGANTARGCGSSTAPVI